MYKITSISNTVTNFVVKTPEGSSLSVNLLPGVTTYTAELTSQIKNLELNGVLRTAPAETEAFSLGNANLVEDNVGHLAIPVEPQLAVAASFGGVNKTASPKKTAQPKTKKDEPVSMIETSQEPEPSQTTNKTTKASKQS